MPRPPVGPASADVFYREVEKKAGPTPGDEEYDAMLGPIVDLFKKNGLHVLKQTRGPGHFVTSAISGLQFSFFLFTASPHGVTIFSGGDYREFARKHFMLATALLLHHNYDLENTSEPQVAVYAEVHETCARLGVGMVTQPGGHNKKSIDFYLHAATAADVDPWAQPNFRIIGDGAIVNRTRGEYTFIREHVMTMAELVSVIERQPRGAPGDDNTAPPPTGCVRE